MKIRFFETSDLEGFQRAARVAVLLAVKIRKWGPSYRSRGTSRWLRNAGVAVGALLAAASGAANAQNLEVPITPDLDNLVGGAVVLIPDYEGSDDYEVAGGPLLNLKFWGERYLQVVGNRAFLNVLNSPNWEAGLKGV